MRELTRAAGLGVPSYHNYGYRNPWCNIHAHSNHYHLDHEDLDLGYSNRGAGDFGGSRNGRLGVSAIRL